MLRIPHCLDNRVTDGTKIVSPTDRPHVTPINVASITTEMFFYLLQSHSPQHASAPTAHLQVEHTSVIFLWCYPYHNGFVVCDFFVVYACGANYSMLIFSFSYNVKITT
jgi:hypothetical protein